MSRSESPMLAHSADTLSSSIIQRFSLGSMLQKGKGLLNKVEGVASRTEHAVESGVSSFASSIEKRAVGLAKDIKDRLFPAPYSEAAPGQEGQRSASKSDGDMTGPFYPRNWSGERMDSPEKALAQQRPAIFINGVRYTLEKHDTAAQDLADELNVVIVGVWNATAEGKPKVGNKTLSKWLGAAYDFAQSLGDKLNDSSNNPATATMVRLIQQYGDAKKPYGGLRILAHSQGSIIVSEALRQAQKAGADISKNDVSTFGNAIYSTPESGTYRHYVSSKDSVSNSVGSRGFGAKAIGKMLHWTQGLRPSSEDEIELDGNKAPSGGRQHTLDKNVDPSEKNDAYSDYIHDAGPLIRKQWAANSQWGYQDKGASGSEAASSPPSGLSPQKGASLGTRRSPAEGIKGAQAASLRNQLVDQDGEGKAPDEGLQKHLGDIVDFDSSKARMHKGEGAAKAAQKMGAEAFTIGRDIFFGANKFNQQSQEGMGLIAHEMEHVGQQIGGKAGSAIADREQEAQQTGQRALAKFGGKGGILAKGKSLLDGALNHLDLGNPLAQIGAMFGEGERSTAQAGATNGRKQSLLNQSERAIRPALEFALALPIPHIETASPQPSQIASEAHRGRDATSQRNAGSDHFTDMDARAVTDRVYQLMKEELRLGLARGLHTRAYARKG